MSDIIKGALALILAIIALVALAFVLNFSGLMSFKFFAPRVEQVRYDTFKESQAFNEGKVNELYAYQAQYSRANDGQKMALRGAILHSFSTYPRERLPADLQQFFAQVQAQPQGN